MQHYWVSIYRPDGYDPDGEEDETMRREIDALNADMIAAGVRVFVGGLQHPAMSKSLRRQPDGSVAATDGAFLKAGSHVGGFWVLACPTFKDALDWGERAAIACRASVEVRAFNA